MLFHKKPKQAPSDRQLHPEHYRDYPAQLVWHSRELAWYDMAMEYLPHMELRLQALRGKMGDKLYVRLNADMDKLAGALLHYRETWHPHGITRLLFHRLRVAIITAEKNAWQFES